MQLIDIMSDTSYLVPRHAACLYASVLGTTEEIYSLATKYKSNDSIIVGIELHFAVEIAARLKLSSDHMTYLAYVA